MNRRHFNLINPKKVPVYVAVIFLIAGLIMVPSGIAIKSSQTAAIAENISVPVEVIRIDSRKAKRRKNESVSRRRQLQYRPVFQTTFPSGEKVTYESRSWSRPSAYETGDQLSGFYNPRTGAIHTPLTIQNQSMLHKILKLLGSIFIAVGALMLGVLSMRKSGRT